MRHFAHSGKSDDRSDWQTLFEHLSATGRLARERGRSLGLEHAASIAGRFHDLGKYADEFDRVLRGEPGPVFDHSTAGGKVLLEQAPRGLKLVAEVLAYAILGHHAGLPDKANGEGGCLDLRIEKAGTPLDPEWREHLPIDFSSAGKELCSHIRPDPAKAGFDLSVAVRMVFSCLVDADFRDTEAFYDSLEERSRDRTWQSLQDLLPDLRKRFDAYMSGFDGSSDLNALRAEVLSHVRGKAASSPGLFTLSVPTGGGKTLASLGFALDHAERHGHTRIIYAIPYTSIIDQTAEVFRNVLGADHVLEHHSAIETQRGNEKGRNKVRLAMEDWAAPVVVTTTVQLFESLFAARPSRCRKLHNVAGAVIVLDEAQTLPRRLLLPTLAMIDTVAALYGCTVVLCTATQPAFDSGQLHEGGLPLAKRELAPDPKALEQKLKRARIVQAGEMDDAALVRALKGERQGFVIVNSRKHALSLFRSAQDEALEGLVHLTTRQYPAHRRRIIATIKDRLARDMPCRLIATSLIEAGVDLDFARGWRAEAGLDSVIQAAGRVNREGTRTLETSVLTVFSAPDNVPPVEVKQLAKAMRATASRFADLHETAAIRDWFEEVYWRVGAERLGKPIVKGMKFTGRSTDFPFRSTAADYRMIDSPMVPVIVAIEPKAQADVARLSVSDVPSGVLAKLVQPYIVQIPERAREVLRANGKGSFHAADLRGDQFFVLDELSLYHEDFGLWWEQAEYLSADQAVV